MRKTSLLHADRITITDNISVRIPTVGNILEWGEDSYFSIAQSLTCVPYDAQVWLDEMGIDYEEISEFELFYMFLQGLSQEKLNWLFCETPFEKLDFAYAEDSSPILIDLQNSVEIDERIQQEISSAIREINFWSKTEKKAGNKASKEYTLQKLKKRYKRSTSNSGYLEELVVAMVNNSEFKYNYETVMELSIYNFNRSVFQIFHARSSYFLNQAIYNGKIDSSKINKDELSLVFKEEKK